MNESIHSQEQLNESIAFATNFNKKFLDQLIEDLNNYKNKDFLRNYFLNTMLCLTTINLHALIKIITNTLVENKDEYDLTFDYVLNDILEKIKLIQENLKSIKIKETH